MLLFSFGFFDSQIPSNNYKLRMNEHIYRQIYALYNIHTYIYIYMEKYKLGVYALWGMFSCVKVVENIKLDFRRT